MIKRNRNVSIGKNTLQSSVGSSLKAKYALKNNVLDKNTIAKAIQKEIMDEFNISNELFDKAVGDLTFDDMVYGFYRDLVEGGKPQLMFFAQINLTSQEVNRHFIKGVSVAKASNSSRIKTAIDGYKIFFVSEDELVESYISPDYIAIKGKCFKIMPSAAITYIELIKKIKEVNKSGNN